MERRIDITWISLWRILLMVIVGVLIFYSRHVLAILFLAIVISSALDAPLNYLEKRKIPRIISIIFLVLSTIAVVTLLLYTVIPVTIIELRDVVSNFSKIGSSLGMFFGIPQLADNFNLNLSSVISTLVSGNLSLADIAPKIFENFIMAITVIVISFYLALYRDGIEGFLRAVLPLEYENYAIGVFKRTRKRIGKWLEGQIFLSFIVAITTFAGLKILGVNYSLVLAILAGIFEIIPFVGPVVAGLIAFLVAMPQSIPLGVYTVLLFIGIHQLESHLIVPLVMRKTTGIHPVIVALSILAGLQIYGIIGVILAIPFVVLIDELVNDFIARKQHNKLL